MSRSRSILCHRYYINYLACRKASTSLRKVPTGWATHSGIACRARSLPLIYLPSMQRVSWAIAYSIHCVIYLIPACTLAATSSLLIKPSPPRNAVFTVSLDKETCFLKDVLGRHGSPSRLEDIF